MAGLFIGRFQPLHRGHLMMIKECAKKVDLLVIALGSANAASSCKNPFTVSERTEMVRRGLQEVGVKNYEIVELPDVESDEEWVKAVVEKVSAVAPTHPLPPLLTSPRAGEEIPSGRGGKSVSPPYRGGVRGGVPPFDLAWSGSKWVQRVFKEYGFPIEAVKEYPGLSATKIRRNMIKGLPWIKYVPLSVRKYLLEIKAVPRVRMLCKLR